MKAFPGESARQAAAGHSGHAWPDKNLHVYHCLAGRINDTEVIAAHVKNAQVFSPWRPPRRLVTLPGKLTVRGLGLDIPAYNTGHADRPENTSNSGLIPLPDTNPAMLHGVDNMLLDHAA